MLKFLKVFNTHAEYEEYIRSIQDDDLPNISICEDETYISHFAIQKDRSLIFDVNPTNIYESIVEGDDGNLYICLVQNIDFSHVEITFGNDSRMMLFDETSYGILIDTETASHYDSSTGEWDGEEDFEEYYNESYKVSFKYVGTEKSLAFEPQIALFEINKDIFNGITEIPAAWLMECNQIERIELPESIDAIGNYAFAYCTSLSDINIPAAVSEISEGMLQNTGLTEIDIPENISTIQPYAFENCKYANKLNIHDDITEIPEYCFRGCESLPEITIGANISNIGAGAFEDCTGLSQIIFEGNIPPEHGTGCFDNTGNCPINVPKDYLEDYREEYSEYANRMKKPIPTKPQNNQILFKSINDKDPIQNFIDEAAAHGETITYNEVLEAYKSQYGTFFYDYNERNLIFDSITDYGDGWFSFNFVEDPGYSSNEIYAIAQGALGVEIYMGDDFGSIIGGVRYITNIILPDSCTILSNKVFWAGCYEAESKLVYLEIQNNVEHIGNYCFGHNELLNTIKFNGTKEQWQNIEKGEYWNDFTELEFIQCTDGTIDLYI